MSGNQGISSVFEVGENDFLEEMEVFYCERAITQIGFRTVKGVSHKVNGAGERSCKEIVNFGKYNNNLVIVPLYRSNKTKGKELYDLLCFDTQKLVFVL